MADEITYVPSKRGGRLLVLHGHMLSLNYNKNNKTYWKCKQPNCYVTAVTENDRLQHHRGEHTHPADSATEMKLLKHRAKEVARTQPHQPIKRVYAEVFGDVDLDDERQVDQLPSMKAMKTALYRSRASRLPRIPTTSKHGIPASTV
jgi:hypothetical protein